MKPQHHTFFAAHFLLVIGIQHQGEHGAVDAHRRLDDVGDIALMRLIVEVGEIASGVFAMPSKVVVGAVGNALQLPPSPGKEILDLEGARGVVRQLLFFQLARSDLVLAHTKDLGPPVHALVAPVLQPLAVTAGFDEELELHLLKLTQPEDEVARRDLVAKRLANLRNTEWNPLASGVDDVLELHEHALRRLRSQKHLGGRVLDRPHVGLEHQVELASVGEVLSATVGTDGLVLRQPGGLHHPRGFSAQRNGERLGILADLARRGQMVGTEATLAPPAIDQRVGKVLHVPRRFPHAGVHDDAAFDADDVVAELNCVAPPQVSQVAPQRDSVRAEVVDGVDPAIYLARLIDEAAPLGQRGDDVNHLALR